MDKDTLKMFLDADYKEFNDVWVKIYQTTSDPEVIKKIEELSKDAEFIYTNINDIDEQKWQELEQHMHGIWQGLLSKNIKPEYMMQLKMVVDRLLSDSAPRKDKTSSK